ncbi:MAG: PLP-dependent aminotransferase family protein [Microbacteriaceae bacterium]|nr:PLP-dependent aminotransferase family protein [Microbacteriaceae bacterium]
MSSLSARALGALLQNWRTSGTGPAYSALADRIRLLVLDGRLPLGTRLPAERELAAHLGLSRTTVSAGYADLRESGYLDSIRGSGSVVRLPSRGSTAAPDPTVSADLLDFSKATLPAVPAVAAASERAAALLPSFLGESGFDALGLRVVRQALADRYTSRGLPTDADEIMITIGAQHAIGLLSRTLLSRGDRALVEVPSYPHAFDALRTAGARLVPVPVTSDEGWDEVALEQAFQRTSPTLGYLMPDHHNPTGTSMSDELRTRTIELAARQGTTLIVDETMAELGLDGQPQRAPFAASGRAVTIGSVGKTIWGGLRLGWIRADRELIQRASRARFALDLGTPIFEQLILLELLPEYDRILVDRREYLRAGRDHLVARLGRDFPQWAVPHPPGGLTVWANLGAPVSSQLALAARGHGLVVAAGPRFGIDGVFERFIRIPFSHPADLIDRAVDALTAAWGDIVRTPMPVGDDELAAVV